MSTKVWFQDDSGDPDPQDELDEVPELETPAERDLDPLPDDHDQRQRSPEREAHVVEEVLYLDAIDQLSPYPLQGTVDLAGSVLRGSAVRSR